MRWSGLLLVTGTFACSQGGSMKTVITGTAGNAKLGPIVQTGKDVVYCLELPRWSEEMVGKTVTVEGTLEKTDRYQAHTDASGAISQGTGGEITVLKGCTVKGPSK